MKPYLRSTHKFSVYESPSESTDKAEASTVPSAARPDDRHEALAREVAILREVQQKLVRAVTAMHQNLLRFEGQDRMTPAIRDATLADALRAEEIRLFGSKGL